MAKRKRSSAKPSARKKAPRKRSVRLPKIIVVAGAGFSAPLGYSTLYDFESAITRYAPTAKPHERKALERLFLQIKRSLVAKGEFTDIEAIMAELSKYVELWDNLRKDHFLKQEFLSTVGDRFRFSAFAQHAIQARSIVDKFMGEHYGQFSDDEEAMASVFGFLEELTNLNGGVLDFFTTNYDVGLEGIWNSVPTKMKLITGAIKRRDGTVRWDPSRLDVMKDQRKGVYVHRLHGCVRWYEDSGANDSRDRLCNVVSVSINSEDRPEDRQPCVMYPGRKLRGSQSPFVEGLTNLRGMLGRVEQCIIIGTSFRDDDILECLIKANDGRERPLKLIIINTANVKERFNTRVQQVIANRGFLYEDHKWEPLILVGSYLDKRVRVELRSLVK